MAYNLRKPPDLVICDHILSEFCLHARQMLMRSTTEVSSKLMAETRELLKAAKEREHSDGRKRSRRYLVLSAVVETIYGPRWKLPPYILSRDARETAVLHSSWSKYRNEQVTEFCTDERADSINYDMDEVVFEKLTYGLINPETAILCLREARTRITTSGVDNLYHPDSFSTWMSEAAETGSLPSIPANATFEEPRVGLSDMPIELVCMVASFMTPDSFLNFRAINHQTRDALENKFLYEYFHIWRLSWSMKSILTLWEISLDLRLSAQLRVLVIDTAVAVEETGEYMYREWRCHLERLVPKFTQLVSCYMTSHPTVYWTLESGVWTRAQDPTLIELTDEDLHDVNFRTLIASVLSTISNTGSFEVLYIHLGNMAQRLMVDGCWKWEYECLNAIRHFEVEVSRIASCNGFDDILEKMPHLESLKIIPVTSSVEEPDVARLQLLDRFVQEGPVEHAHLRQLAYTGLPCEHKTLCQLARRFPSLEVLSLYDCDIISSGLDYGEHWRQLLQNLARLPLRHLEISGCEWFDKSFYPPDVPRYHFRLPDTTRPGETTDMLSIEGDSVPERLRELALEATVEMLEDLGGIEDFDKIEDIDEAEDSDEADDPNEIGNPDGG